MGKRTYCKLHANVCCGGFAWQWTLYVRNPDVNIRDQGKTYKTRNGAFRAARRVAEQLGIEVRE